jgi:hypothetical protein
VKQSWKIKAANPETFTSEYRVVHVMQDMKSNGKTVFKFDTEKAGDLQRMREDPRLAEVLESLESVIELRQNTDGSLINFKFDGPDGAWKLKLKSELEDLIEVVERPWPEQMVKPGDTWVTGKWRTSLSGIGVFSAEQCSKFLAIGKSRGPGPREGERLALVGFKSKHPEFRPDTDVWASASLWQFDHLGQALFSLDRGRPILIRNHRTLVLRLVNSVGLNVIVIARSVHLEVDADFEIPDNNLGWMIPPEEPPTSPSVRAGCSGL